MNRVELKTKAKESLKGKYGDAIKVVLIPVGFSLFIAFFVGFLGLEDDPSAFVSDALSIVVSALITFGTYSYYLKLSHNEEVTYKELFSKVNMFLPCIAIAILVWIFTFLWSLLFVIPGIIAALSYSLVFYVKLDNPELSPTEVIKKSKQMMKGHKWDLFVLELSFLGWAILGVFTFGILYLWLIPYMQVTYANFYNSLKENTTI